MNIGGTKDELKRRMSAREFEDWRIFYHIRPFGPWHDDYRFACLEQLIASCVSSKRQPIKDFMCVQPQKREQTKEEMLSVFRAVGMAI